jgi:hypothetical protein
MAPAVALSDEAAVVTPAACRFRRTAFALIMSEGLAELNQQPREAPTIFSIRAEATNVVDLWISPPNVTGSAVSLMNPSEVG